MGSEAAALRELARVARQQECGGLGWGGGCVRPGGAGHGGCRGERAAGGGGGAGQRGARPPHQAAWLWSWSRSLGVSLDKFNPQIPTGNF
jgi:hypothetical protein